MRKPPKEQIRQALALAALLLIAGFAVAGPTGLLAWNESEEVLKLRQAQIAQLQAERDALKNKVDRLNPDGADPDLVGELLRSNLNVVHPDEVVITLEDE
ncbi:septum formation initiator [Altererythrobacter sp. BO-6]|uniref:FtsB family cell division protein n=1 Tax=Altererythrobacter sp. BO-6 TaxID=2604537 RepID=UPI0013E20067|nr:septum formation initiator family protein [Altererythrobacter sp. BO-6]QIG52891.1 septum formation initiator [Altererythrobacter sp. BO-6]